MAVVLNVSTAVVLSTNRRENDRRLHMGTARAAPTRYEYHSETSQKFWEGSVKGAAFIVRFGRIGTDGQTRTTTHASASAARDELLRRTREKLAEGYKPAAHDRMRCYDATPIDGPKFVTSECIGEHLAEGVLTDLCTWLTACIRSGMTAAQFARVWNRLMEDDEEILWSLGRTEGEAANALQSEFWVDNLQEGDVADLYRRAVAGHADRFIWFNNNAYIDVVACRGDPGARALCVGVLEETNCKDENGRWLTEWPQELGPGASILYIHEAFPPSCMLRDGRRIIARKP